MTGSRGDVGAPVVAAEWSALGGVRESEPDTNAKNGLCIFELPVNVSD